MMGKYGNAAVRATELVRSGTCNSPKNAWEAAVQDEFLNSRTAQKKGCPRGSYLGLCEEGLIIGVESGRYTESKFNKMYAICAVRILKKKPSLASEKKALWERVTRGQKKVENSQMDVVLTLWEKGCIDSSKI